MTITECRKRVVHVLIGRTVDVFVGARGAAGWACLLFPACTSNAATEGTRVERVANVNVNFCHADRTFVLR